MSEAVLCPSCGAKVNAAHDRCPRCRARFRPDPEVTARHSKKLAQWSAALGASFVIVVGGLWLMKDDEPATVTTPRRDPFADRRQPKPTAEPAQAAAKPAEPTTPFLEPSGAGASAYATGDYQSALEQYKAAIAKNPEEAESHSNLGQILVRLGKPAEAIPHFEKAKGMGSPPFVSAFLAYAYGASGDRARSRAELEDTKRLSLRGSVTPFNLALSALGHGDHGRAVSYLEQAYASDSQWLGWLGRDRIFDPLRSDPRFAALMKKLGFDDR